LPLAHNGYCPSHQHLAETEESQEIEQLQELGELRAA
jgi:hypothetical protein